MLTARLNAEDLEPKLHEASLKAYNQQVHMSDNKLYVHHVEGTDLYAAFI